VRAKFNQYTRKNGRIEKIVRTEITRASNKSQDEAYKQSGVVQSKEWYTALDERVSQECAALHGTKVSV
jgi:SPP1 gp7 family putative phage head morphogenesis protein